MIKLRACFPEEGGIIGERKTSPYILNNSTTLVKPPG